jgi:hypothetical protein
MLGKQATELLIAPPDGRANNVGTGKKAKKQSSENVEVLDSNHDDENLKQTDPTATRLRAILRAPQPVQQLYREGLIGQQVAARRRSHARVGEPRHS